MDNEDILQRLREFEHRLSMFEFNNEDRQQMMGGQMAGIPIPQQFTPVNPTSFLVEKEKKSWRMCYPEGAYAYAGIRPKTVSPEPQDDYIVLDWIENNAGEVYAHVEVELENEQTQIKGVNSITFDGEEGESESESGNIRTITFHIATIEKGEVAQTAFGEIREGDYLKKPGNGRLFIVVGDDSSASDNGTDDNSDSSSAAATFTANQTGDSTIKIPKANDGKLKIVAGDESESESLGEFTANQKDDAKIKIPKVNDGKLKIVAGDESESLGEFTANQKDDTKIKIPKANNGKFTVYKANGTTVLAEFSANQSRNTSLILPDVNNGKLTIKYHNGSQWITEYFFANASTNTTIEIPAAPPAANNGKLTIKKSDGTSLGEFTANQASDKTIMLPEIPKPITPPSGGGELSFVADVRYDPSTHQLQKKVGTLTIATGAVVVGDWVMMEGGQCTPHIDEHESEAE